MNAKRLTLCCLVVLGCLLAQASAAQAQATRTWVSGVGDDINPCSRTAPCKTWAGAISKTAEGGEMNAMDPGAYGALTITKSITVNGRGTLASTLATAGTSGITVNAEPTDVVIIRDVDIIGARRGSSPGVKGIRYLKAKSLHVYNTTIRGFSNSCIIVEGSAADTSPLTTPLRLHVRRNELADCAHGIALAPNNTNKAIRASVRGTSIDNFDLFGVYASGQNIRGTFRDVSIAGGTPEESSNGTGVFTEGASKINLESSLVEGNHVGLRPLNTSIIRVSNTTITDNTTGLLPNGGQLLSRLNNTVQDNDTNGAFTGTYGAS